MHTLIYTSLRQSIRIFLYIAVGLVPIIAAAQQPRRVLILDQGDLTSPYFTEHTLAVRTALTKDTSEQIEIYTERLDIDRFPNQEHQQKLVKWLKDKYGDRGINVIITEGPEALSFAFEFRSALRQSIPIVFTAIEEYYVGRMALPPNVTGVASVSSIKDSIQLINHMLPGTKRIVVLGDRGTPGSYLVDVSREFFQIELKRELNVMIGMPVMALLSRVGSLPADTSIIYLGITIDNSTGQYYSPNELLTTFTKVANRPIFVTSDFLLSHGAVGGLVTSSTDGASEVAEMTRRVLNGESASAIPILHKDSRRPVFDAKAITKWEIDKAYLPPGSELINYEPTLWEKYSLQIVIIVSVVILQTTLIVALILEHRQRRKAELKFRRSMSDLAHLSRTTALGELSASIAHELNQPLAAIMSNAEAAEQLIHADPPSITEAKDALADIRRDDQRASDIIRSMRSLFKKNEFAPTAVDINKVVNETLQFVRWEARSKKVTVTAELGKNLPLVTADETQLKQVILNLLLNAIDAASAAAKEGVVTIATHLCKPHFVELYVEDTGHGIPSEMVAQIFDPYYTTKESGIGMGLSISRTIIEAHRSRLNVHNVDGGARFSFTLAEAK